MGGRFFARSTRRSSKQSRNSFSKWLYAERSPFVPPLGRRGKAQEGHHRRRRRRLDVSVFLLLLKRRSVTILSRLEIDACLMFAIILCRTTTFHVCSLVETKAERHTLVVRLLKVLDDEGRRYTCLSSRHFFTDHRTLSGSASRTIDSSDRQSDRNARIAHVYSHARSRSPPVLSNRAILGRFVGFVRRQSPIDRCSARLTFRERLPTID